MEIYFGGMAVTKCSELMTPNPVCCLASDPIQKAADLMKSEDVGSVPVVSDQQTRKLVGIITDRDIAIKAVAAGMDGKTAISSVMTKNPSTCKPDDDVESAMQTMSEKQVRRIPVVDQSGAVCGIIAQADIATRLDEPEETKEMLEEISQSK